MKSIFRRFVSPSPMIRLDAIMIAVLVILIFTAWYPVLSEPGFVYRQSYYFPYSPEVYFTEKFGSSWDHVVLGRPAIILQNLPYISFVVGLSYALGVDLASTILPVVLWIISSLSTFWFLRRFVRASPIPSFFGSLYISFNLFVIDYVLRSFNLIMLLSYSSLLAVIYFSSTYLKSGKMHHLIGAGLSLFFMAVWPPSIIIAGIGVAVYIFLLLMKSVICKNVTKLGSARRTVILLGIFAFATSHIWTTMLLSQSLTTALPLAYSPSTMSSILKSNSEYLLLPLVTIGLGQLGGAGLPFQFHIIIHVIILTIVFLTLILGSGSFNFRLSYLLALFSISIFLMKGINEPLPQVYPWLFNNVPFFSLLRNPAHFRILYYAAFAALIASCIQHLLSRLGSTKMHGTTASKCYPCKHRMHAHAYRMVWSLVLITILLGSIVLMSSPIFVFKSVYEEGRWPVRIERIPDYYGEARDYLLEHNRDMSRLLIPGTHVATFYNWSFTPIETPVLSTTFPTISGLPLSSFGISSQSEYRLVEFALDAIRENREVGLSEIMGILNAKYLVLQRDMRPSPWYDPTREIDINGKTLLGLKRVKTFGKIELFENERFRPNIYIADSLIEYDTFDSLIAITEDVTMSNAAMDIAYVEKALFEDLMKEGSFSHVKKYTSQIPLNLTVLEPNLSNCKGYAEGRGDKGMPLILQAINGLNITIPKGPYASSQVVYDFPDLQSFEEWDFLILEFFGSNKGENIDLLLYSPELPPKAYNYYRWVFQDDFEGWKSIMINLHEPNHPQFPTYGSPSLDTVARIGFNLKSLNTSWMLGNITLITKQSLSALMLGEYKVGVFKECSSYNVIREASDRFIIKVDTVESPILLVLSDLYDPLWELKPLSASAKEMEIEHIKVNWYANGWLIEGDVGDLTMVLEYGHRNTFLASFYLALTFIIFSLLSLTLPHCFRKIRSLFTCTRSI